MDKTLLSAKVMINPNRRRHDITIRWTIEYLVSQVLVVAGESRTPIKIPHALEAMVLLQNPTLLVQRLKEHNMAVSPDNFPPYVLDTLSVPLPASTRRHELAVGAAIARGLLTGVRTRSSMYVKLTAAGRNLVQSLHIWDGSQALRARLALEVARKIRVP